MKNKLPMTKKFLSAFALLMLFVTVQSQAQIKIGFMDVQSVMAELPEMENIRAKLDDFVTQKQQQLQDRTASFQEAVADYQENQASMSAQEQQTREDELATMEEELRTFQQSIQTEIQQYRQELLAPIYADIDNAIANIAEERDLDFVLNKATMRGENIVQFSAQQSFNITDEVIKRISSNSNQN
jgi:outer membrane protein